MPKDLSISSLLDVYGCFLSDKQRIIAEYYYDDDLSLAEIAENEGISRQAVCDILRRAENQMKLWESSCGLLKKITELRELKAIAEAGDSSANKKIYAVIDEF